MKKVVDFLERHVQWVAVGLGGLYLLWVAWTFLIGSPVKVQVNGENLGPGEIDKYIVDHPVSELSTQMQNTSVPKFTVPPWREQFVATMEMKDINPLALAGLWTESMPVPQITTPSGNQVVPGPVVKIEKLPDVPAAEPTEVVAGASNVNKAQAAVAGAQPPPADNAAQPVANNGVDCNWTTVGFRVSNKAMNEAFNAVKIPKFLSNTCFLTVHLQRQEMQQDGTWGSPVDVKIPPTVALSPMPADSAAAQDKQQFVTWAAAHQPDILQPAFWPVLIGDKWSPPGDGATTKPAVELPQGLPDFDPNKWDYTPEEIKRMTPQQHAQWAKAKEKHDADERKQKAGERGGRQGGKGGKGGGGAVGGGGPRGPGDPGRPPGVPYPGPRPPYPGPERGDYEPAPPPPTVYPCPQGMFDPSNVVQQAVQPGQPMPQDKIPEFWIGWAHDDSVEPGHVYRFRVTYSIRSPLFGAGNFANPQKLADTLVLTSPPSAWSKEIKIPLRTSFYMASNPSTSGNVRFEVFAWQGGVKRGKVFDLQPGDIIGGTDGGVSYNTGWTVVAIGRDPIKDFPYVLIADPKGNLSKRDYTSDQSNPDYKNDKAAAANANAAASAGGSSGQ